MQFEHRKIGEILVEMGALAPAEVRLVLDQQSQSGHRFGETAIAHGLLSDELIAQALAQQFGLEYVDLDTIILDAELDATLPSELPIRYNFIPLKKTDDGLVIAISDPTNVAELDDLEMTSEAASALEKSIDAVGLSARGWDRVRRIARTIADLAESTTIESGHVEEAVVLRGSKT
jgi:hypothetical protein